MLRHLIGAAASVGLALALGVTAAVAEPRKLVISVYGISQDAYRKHLYAPFEAQCDCKIVVETGNSQERLAKLEARKDNPNIDLAVLTDFNAMEAARKGLTVPIDVSKISNYGKLYPFAQDPVGGHLGIGYTFYATSIVHRTDKVKITSWKDLWKPELKGRVAFPDISTSQGPLLLYMADSVHGGTTPDFKTGIDKVAAIKKDVVTFYARSSQLVQLFQQEEIWAAVTGRFNWPLIIRLNMPIAWASPTEGQTGGLNVMVLVKGSQNADLALRFMDFWLSDEVQGKIALDLVDSPANSAIKLPEKAAAALTYGPEMVKSIRFLPPAQVNENLSAWIAGWNDKIAR